MLLIDACFPALTILLTTFVTFQAYRSNSIMYNVYALVIPDSKFINRGDKWSPSRLPGVVARRIRLSCLCFPETLVTPLHNGITHSNCSSLLNQQVATSLLRPAGSFTTACRFPLLSVRTGLMFSFIWWVRQESNLRCIWRPRFTVWCLRQLGILTHCL